MKGAREAPGGLRSPAPAFLDRPNGGNATSPSTAAGLGAGRAVAGSAPGPGRGEPDPGWRIFGSRWGLPLLIVGLALLLAYAEAVQVYLGFSSRGRPITWGDALGATVPSWILLALLTPAILWVSGRFPVDRDRWRRSLPIQVLAALAFTLLHLAGTALAGELRPGGTPVGFPNRFSGLATFYFVLDMLTYGAIVGVGHAFHFYRESRAREVATSQLLASLSEARLEALRGQINPHFLFNTLNAVSSLTLKGERDAVLRVLDSLSVLLRVSLDDERPQEVPLSEELEFLDGYLAIQQARFADRLRVTREIEPQALDALVPTMIMQPLVENAIAYGVASRPGAGRVAIRALRRGGLLELRVEDFGPGFSAPGSVQREGIGLRNTRERLLQLYGPAHRFEYGNRPEGGAFVTIALPLRAAAREYASE